MNHVRDMFCNIINDEVEAYGFHHYRNMYYKTVGEALIGFNIYANRTYTLRFGCYPLCGEIVRHVGSFSDHEIVHILPQYRDTYLYVIPWGENVSEAEQTAAWENRSKIYEDIAYQLADELRTVLLPKLLKIDSTKAAFDFEKECCLAATLYQDKRFAAFADSKMQTHTLLALFADCFWNLQMRKVQKAEACLENWLKSVKIRCEQDDFCGMTYYDQHYLEQKALCSMLSRGSSDEIEKYIAEREDITLKNFGLKRQKVIK